MAYGRLRESLIENHWLRDSDLTSFLGAISEIYCDYMHCHLVWKTSHAGIKIMQFKERWTSRFFL